VAKLASIAAVKQFLSISNSNSDAVLGSLIDAYSAAVESYCSRRFSQQTYNERRSGNGKNSILLINYPVISIASVSTTTAQNIAQAPAFPGTGTGWYQLDVSQGDGRMIVLGGYAFDRGRGNVMIVYDAGYPVGGDGVVQVPADLSQALVEMVALRFKARDNIGYRSKTLATETIMFDMSAMPASVKMVLQVYRQEAIPL
jgi:uncharacterized phiE125 gp8 family phage protein